MDINELDFSPYKAKINGYILRKDIVVNESYTNEDVIIVGLRKLAKEKEWQEKHGSQSQKVKMDKLKAAIVELGGDPTEYLQ
jgi:hypothetical protein